MGRRPLGARVCMGEVRRRAECGGGAVRVGVRDRGGRRERRKEGRKEEKKMGKRKRKGGERERKGERDGEIRAAIAAPVGLAQRHVRARTRPQGSSRGLEIEHLEQREIPEYRVRGLGGF